MRSELAAAVQALRAAAIGRSGPMGPGYLPMQLVPGRAGQAVHAIDGSSAVVLDTGSIWVVAHRATAVAWPGSRVPEPAVQVTATPVHAADAALDAAWAGSPGVPAAPPSVRDAEGFVEALRSLAEWRRACAAIEAAAPHGLQATGSHDPGPAGRGGLVLLDGALRGQPRHAQAFSDDLVARADAAGVRLVAVAKRSALADPAPIPQLLRDGPAGPWAVETGRGTWIAKLHPRARSAFRVDAPDLADVAALASLCEDAVYTGYPYPLALAHNIVAITGEHARLLRDAFVEEARRGGLAHLVEDFHAVLDRGVPR